MLWIDKVLMQITKRIGSNDNWHYLTPTYCVTMVCEDIFALVGKECTERGQRNPLQFIAQIVADVEFFANMHAP